MKQAAKVAMNVTQYEMRLSIWFELLEVPRYMQDYGISDSGQRHCDSSGNGFAL